MCGHPDHRVCPPQGEGAVRIGEGQRDKNVTICLAINSLSGLVHSAIMGRWHNPEQIFWFGNGAGATRSSYNNEPYILLCDMSLCIMCPILVTRAI